MCNKPLEVIWRRRITVLRQLKVAGNEKHTHTYRVKGFVTRSYDPFKETQHKSAEDEAGGKSLWSCPWARLGQAPHGTAAPRQDMAGQEEGSCTVEPVLVTRSAHHISVEQCFLRSSWTN